MTKSRGSLAAEKCHYNHDLTLRVYSIDIWPIPAEWYQPALSITRRIPTNQASGACALCAMPTSSWRVASGSWSGRRGAGCSLSPLLPCCPRVTGRRGFHPAHWCAKNVIKRLAQYTSGPKIMPPLPPPGLNMTYFTLSLHCTQKLLLIRYHYFLPFSHKFTHLTPWYFLFLPFALIFPPFLSLFWWRCSIDILSPTGGGGEGTFSPNYTPGAQQVCRSPLFH